jgi:hypothetical protein
MILWWNKSTILHHLAAFVAQLQARRLPPQYANWFEVVLRDSSSVWLCMAQAVPHQLASCLRPHTNTIGLDR